MANHKGIYKRGNVYWLTYKGIDGRIIRESSGSQKFAIAEVLLNTRRKAVDDGDEQKVTKIKNFSFIELAREYLVWCQRQKNYDMKKVYIKHFVELYGNLPLKRFNTLLVEKFQTSLLKKGLKHATVNRYIATLKHMFTKAVDWEMVAESVLKKVRTVEMLKENNKRLRFLSKEEVQELVSHCAPYLKPIVVTALNTGMRISEILNLAWKQVDLKHGFIRLEVTKNGERREIPINRTLRNELRGVKRRLDIPYVFFNESTGNAYKRDLRTSFKSACRKAGIDDFTFHDLRHTFASHAVMAGVDLCSVQKLLGHANLDMTLRYSHLSEGHLKDAVEMLDTRFNESSTSQFTSQFTKK